MKRIIIFVVIIFCTALPVCAQEEEKNIFDEQLERISKQSEIEFEDIKDSPIESIFEIAKQYIIKGAARPMTVFYKIAAILLLSAIINFFATAQSKNISQFVNMVCVLVIFYNVFSDFTILMEDVSTTLFNIKNFLITFLPVFAGISMASGELITSTVYTGFFLISIVWISDFCVKYILPSINLFLAIGVTSSISSAIKLKSLCEFYSKAVKLAMTAAVSILCFALTLQTAITQGQDTLAIKTGKLFVTSAVPIIGSALQSAVGSVYASMKVLKGFSGILGLAGILQIFLPTIVTLSANWCGFYAVIILSDILENETAMSVLATFKDTIEILLSMTVLFLVLLIFSLCVMIKQAQGV
ncbi:MAG: hypothetical protein RR728_01375 [Oscillospiraceae bacterium]